MPIRNYSSKVKPASTLGEIQALLSEHGASQISMDYENGKPIALSFKMLVRDVFVSFRLTVDVEGMLRAMKKDKKVPKSACNPEQAERTAWKNKYEWLHIQMAEIESEQARIEQLLLGYAVTPQGETFFEALQSNQRLLAEVT